MKHDKKTLEQSVEEAVTEQIAVADRIYERRRGNCDISGDKEAIRWSAILNAVALRYHSHNS